MFEIEAHYYNRKIYLSDGRVFPLGEILLRCFSASFPDIETIYEVCRKAKSNLQVDPVWLIYTRAYKQHYARFMKKTMSKTEFAQWAEYALDLRQKALDGEIGIEEYTELIRK